MKFRLRVALLIGLAILLFQRGIASTQRFQQDFIERVWSLTLDNTDGPTEVRSWDRSTVRIIASRRDSEVLASELSVDREREHLRVGVHHKEGSSPIAVILYAPSSIALTITSTSGDVAVAGTFRGLSIVTDSGPVTIRLPAVSNADLSLRTLGGKIQQDVPITLFGNRDTHALDGRIGAGGPAVIARSTRGDISVVPADASQLIAMRNLPESADDRSHAFPISRGTGERSNPYRDARQIAGTIGTGANEDVIKLEGRLVNLNVKVSDAGGRTLPSLKKEDFLVYEDGLQQEVSFFEPVTAPLNIVLLLDLSGSTEKKIKVMKKAAQKFVDSLKPTDAMAVAAFTRRFFVIANFTTDHKLLKDRIDDIKNRHAGTAYYDAMWSTLDLLQETTTTRKAVVVLTDGVDNSLDHPDDAEFDPKHGFDELLARVEEADVTIYPIYLDTEYEVIGRRGRNGHDAYMLARKQLESLAEQTGAVMYKAERAEDLEGVYQQVAAELHSLYSMGYAPKSVRRDGTWKKIGVAVNLPGAKVRTKRGYYAR